MTERPRCTLVVPARNSERTIEACLKSIRQQTIPCELIVVDNSSTDRTPTVAARLADVVIDKGPERSAQRNAGLAIAQGDVVGFIDSDMELDPTVAEEAVALIDAGAGGVIVPEYTDGTGFWVGVRRLERSFYDGDDGVEAARIFKRQLLDEVGGFDETMSPGPEDWDLSNRVRLVLRIDRTMARIRHDEGSIRYLEACRKKAYYAQGLRSYHAKHGTALMLSALDRPYIRRPWKLLFPHPILGVGVVALKAGEATAATSALLGAAPAARRTDRVSGQPTPVPRISLDAGEATATDPVQALDPLAISGGVQELTSAVIVAYKAGTDLLDCVASLIEQEGLAEVVVVDNCSADGSVSAAVQRYPDIRVVEMGSNVGFGAAANAGATASSGDVLLFLNPDVVLMPGAVGRLAEATLRLGGIVGPLLKVGPDHHLEFGATINHLGMPRAINSPGQPLYVPGSVLALTRRDFNRLGGFDSRYFLFVEDVELCWRALRAGLEVAVVPEARGTHRGGAVARGGYPVRGMRYSTTKLRVTLRERNTVALMISCAPSWWLAWVIPILMVRSVTLAVGASLLGHVDLSRNLLRIWAWNARQLPTSLRRRRSCPRAKGGQRAATSRIIRGAFLLSALREGLPQLIRGGPGPNTP
ncbi:MAG: glycosyltransferase family 2 protein [Candidatus Dormibacteraceae bacterium]